MRDSGHDEKRLDYPVDQFQGNGFAFCRVLSTQEAGQARKQIVEFWKRADDEPLQGIDRFKIHLFLSEVNRIVHQPILLEAVRTALQTPHVALWSSDLNIKQAHSRQYFSAHQDATYTGLQPATQCLTVWVALSDPVGLLEGCLSFLRGSHLAGQLPHVEELDTLTEDANMLSRGQWVLHEGNPEEWVAIPLRAGEATLHHFHTIHKSGHNQHPTQPRVGLALRYVSHRVRQTGPVRECITWIDNSVSSPEENAQARQELEQVFDLEPHLPTNPTEEDIAAGRKAHAEAMHRESCNYFLDSDHVKAYVK